MRHLLVLSLFTLLPGCSEDDLTEIITDVTEIHYQGGGTVDILFVVDNSGSMDAEQEALGRGFEAFIDSFLALETDFHIGITNMDYQNTAGTLLGEPKFLTAETPNLLETFIENARVGIFGSGTEKGMEAARQALGPAKTENENEGFLREGAVLVIVFVSDEDDQSTADNETYLDFFLELKHGDRRRVSISAIAGPVPDGCDTALAGSRYLEMTELTGGAFESICQEDLGMPSLGRLLAGYHVDFKTEYTPKEGSVAVFIDGEEIEEGPDTWTLVNGEISFADGAVPPDCSEVQIAYRTGERVSGVEQPLVFENQAPICATPGALVASPAPERGCRATPTEPVALALLLLLGIAFRRRQRWTS